MIQSKKYTFDLIANGSLRMPITGSFIRVIAALGLFDLKADNVSIENATIADGFKEKPFQFIELKDRSGAANTVTLVVSDAEFLNAPATSTSITSTKNPQLASLAHTAPALGVASAQLIANNSGRQYLMVQNQDTLATLWIRSGVAAAVAGVPCIKISPGGFWEWDGVGVQSAWQAISDRAAPAITVVEG